MNGKASARQVRVAGLGVPFCRCSGCFVDRGALVIPIRRVIVTDIGNKRPPFFLSKTGISGYSG